MNRSHLFARTLLAGVVLWAQTAPARGQASTDTTPRLGALVESMSEPGGYFDTDNLVSNEASYVTP